MLGDGIRLAALPLLATHVTGDPLLVSMVVMAGRLPWLVFGLIAGAVVDRYDRRRLMWWTDVLRAVLMAGLALAVFTDRVTIWVLIVFTFALASAGVLFDSASPALLPALVTPEEEPLRRANGRLFAAHQVSQDLAGPAIGGALFAVAVAAPFAIDALSFCVSAVLLAQIGGRFRVDRTDRVGTSASSLWREIVEGLRWLRHHRLLRTLALLAAAVNIAVTAGTAVLVLLVTQRLHVTEAGYGLLLATGALGGLAGSVIASGITERLGTAITMRYAIAAIMVGSGGIALAPNAWACGVALAVIAFAAVVLNVVTSPLRQMLVPDALRGRVVSAYRMVALGGGPLGAVLGGLVSTWFGLHAPYVLGTVLVAGCVVVAWRTITTDAVASARAASAASRQEGSS
jgi:MFS family permease